MQFNNKIIAVIFNFEIVHCAKKPRRRNENDKNTAIYIDGKKYTIDDVKSLIQENKNLHQELQNTIHDLNLLLVGSL